VDGVASVRGCNLPEDLYYLVERHVWARPEPDGLVTVGMTDVAQNMAGKIIVVTPKAPGRSLVKGKSAGTLESGKWVGAVPSPVSGEIVAVNAELKRNPGLVNQDPYGAGWIIRLKPSDWEGEKRDLATGPEGIEAYRRFMEQEGLECA
jgi:glycine cleavage system H protein